MGDKLKADTNWKIKFVGDASFGIPSSNIPTIPELYVPALGVRGAIFEIENSLGDKGTFTFGGVSVTSGIGYASANPTNSWSDFKTKNPVTLNDFDGKFALITNVSVGLCGGVQLIGCIDINDINIENTSFLDWLWNGNCIDTSSFSNKNGKIGLTAGSQLGVNLSYATGALHQIDSHTVPLNPNPNDQNSSLATLPPIPKPLDKGDRLNDLIDQLNARDTCINPESTPSWIEPSREMPESTKLESNACDTCINPESTPSWIEPSREMPESTKLESTPPLVEPGREMSESTKLESTPPLVEPGREMSESTKLENDTGGSGFDTGGSGFNDLDYP